MVNYGIWRGRISKLIVTIMKSKTLRVAILTNFIPPYRLSFYKHLLQNVGQLKIFLSVPMEENRNWPVEWSGLDVCLQKTITIPRIWRHPIGFKEKTFLHFPYDTIPQLRHFKPDVIVSVEMGFRTAQAVIFKIICPKTKLIFWEAVSEHTENGRGKLLEIIRSLLLRFADAVWVNGKSGERYILTLGVPSGKIFKIPYTIDEKVFGRKQKTSASDRLRLAIIGQLVERKGILPFLNQLDKWVFNHPDTKIKISFYGEGPLRQKLERRSSPKNLSLEINGSFNYLELPRIYSEADIVVFPTLADEWGVVVNEAMASGKPVLGSVYSQGVDEMIIDNINGWTFRPDDSDNVQNAFQRAFLISIEERQKIGKLAKERVNEFSVSVAVERMCQSFDFVLGKPLNND
jgi:glycosyltransferase involved in cell wall biosynthesis